MGWPQFQDLLRHGDASPYRDFFIDWNEFWDGHGDVGPEGYIVPRPSCLEPLFLRKPGLPVLMVRFPDGRDRPYWNTFYQRVTYKPLAPRDLAGLPSVDDDRLGQALEIANNAVAAGVPVTDIDWAEHAELGVEIADLLERNRQYLGQMDLNARSEAVWRFYDETPARLGSYGASLIRLDAFAYLHKEPCTRNFFNRPGTWDYLARLRSMADGYGLDPLPEIHAQYGEGLHAEVAARGFRVYDFFLPGLLLHALDLGLSAPLLRWVRELRDGNIATINMLGCHDGIPVLDLRGSGLNGDCQDGLLSHEEIEATISRIIDRGGRVKNLFGPDGRKIAYYQVNATFFSALGEDERKLLLARAIQMFVPGVPQVWYLDLFAGRNDYAAADRGGEGGHKELNRSNLSMEEVGRGLERRIVREQLKLIALRNKSPAFSGALALGDCDDHTLDMTWRHGQSHATLRADLRSLSFTITHRDNGGSENVLAFDGAQ